MSYKYRAEVKEINDAVDMFKRNMKLSDVEFPSEETRNKMQYDDFLDKIIFPIVYDNKHPLHRAIVGRISCALNNPSDRHNNRGWPENLNYWFSNGDAEDIETLHICKYADEYGSFIIDDEYLKSYKNYEMAIAKEKYDK